MVQKTTGSAPQNARTDFDKKGFSDLIQQKGKDVVIEKAIQCPCKSEAVNAQSNCKNCGGTGFIFVNPKEVRMVMQKINLVNDFAPWSEENRGFVNISYEACEELAWMDKITDKNGISIFNQVLFFKAAEDSSVFTYTTYPIKKALYVGLFKGVDEPIQKLVENVDFTIERNIVRLINDDLIQDTVQNTNITIRYKHSPVFHVVEMKRETMETFEFNDGKEVLKHMPLNAIARRAHYISNIENLSGNRLLNNNYPEKNCNVYMPAKKIYLPISKTFTEETISFTDIHLINKMIIMFRNGQQDNQYTLDLSTGTVTPTNPYQENEYITIYILSEVS